MKTGMIGRLEVVMTPLGHGQLAQWMRSSRSLRAAEVCLITLSNDAVSYIAWRYHLDLYVVLAVTLYLYIGARYLRHLHLDFHLSYSRVGISAAVGAGLAVPAIIFI